MSRKSKKQGEAQSGGYVPATYHGTHNPQEGGLASKPPTASNGTSVSYNQYSRSTAHYENRKKAGGSRVAKVVVALVVIAAIAAVSALGFYVFRESQKASINEDLHDNFSQSELEAIDNELTGMTKFDEPFTMLLLGSDARSDNPDMGARTDTIILCRIDPIQNVVSMVSIPRDTKIVYSGSTMKFNAAYTYGGPSGTISAVKDLCGVDIDHYAEINFEGLVGLVDAIGGIDVMVDETIDDPDAGPVVIPAGEQHLDGTAALVMSRSRNFADGDFSRVANQRKVIEAIVRKGLEAPATELYGLVKASTSFLTTDSGMDVDFIFSLADQMRHNELPVTLYTATIPSTTGMIGDVSYVIADDYGVEELMEVFVAGGDVSYGEAHQIEVGEQTEQSGAASAGSAASSASADSSGASAASESVSFD